ncbi:uncharacterized protein BXIN_2218 [Babesia sp. Xinjiang]|uniref:uncharacterized protein n=1 Tax=Babesia sp. Xinjiang TaxID=462227 RepID=UPI000A26180C|nr:uncharacterized protein BXIN_0806 [Babesia sp. Xinjiang]XP_028872424.1 uncharacterized protein BXIN_2218 [Babesia sp. Xinjiang]ORM41305.1 hypothetical protein BXIN_0806 [Babesia sp. Xinjiang]ORM41968.1 hypothetical protein BXIN_2218 [Babesia sp. Xinjiang]
MLSQHLGGPVLLDLDITPKAKTHPLIVAQTTKSKSGDLSSYTLRNTYIVHRYERVAVDESVHFKIGTLNISRLGNTDTGHIAKFAFPSTGVIIGSQNKVYTIVYDCKIEITIHISTLVAKNDQELPNMACLEGGATDNAESNNVYEDLSEVMPKPSDSVTQKLLCSSEPSSTTSVNASPNRHIIVLVFNDHNNTHDINEYATYDPVGNSVMYDFDRLKQIQSSDQETYSHGQVTIHLNTTPAWVMTSNTSLSLNPPVNTDGCNSKEVPEIRESTVSSTSINDEFISADEPSVECVDSTIDSVSSSCQKNNVESTRVLDTPVGSKDVSITAEPSSPTLNMGDIIHSTIDAAFLPSGKSLDELIDSFANELPEISALGQTESELSNVAISNINTGEGGLSVHNTTTEDYFDLASIDINFEDIYEEFTESDLRCFEELETESIGDDPIMDIFDRPIKVDGVADDPIVIDISDEPINASVAYDPIVIDISDEPVNVDDSSDDTIIIDISDGPINVDVAHDSTIIDKSEGPTNVVDVAHDSTIIDKSEGPTNVDDVADGSTIIDKSDEAIKADSSGDSAITETSDVRVVKIMNPFGSKRTTPRKRSKTESSVSSVLKRPRRTLRGSTTEVVETQPTNTESSDAVTPERKDDTTTGSTVHELPSQNSPEPVVEQGLDSGSSTASVRSDTSPSRSTIFFDMYIHPCICLELGPNLFRFGPTDSSPIAVVVSIEDEGPSVFPLGDAIDVLRNYNDKGRYVSFCVKRNLILKYRITAVLDSRFERQYIFKEPRHALLSKVESFVGHHNRWHYVVIHTVLVDDSPPTVMRTVYQEACVSGTVTYQLMDRTHDDRLDLFDKLRPSA